MIDYVPRIASRSLEDHQPLLVELAGKLYDAHSSWLVERVRPDHIQDAHDFERDHAIRADMAVWQVLKAYGIRLDLAESQAIELALIGSRIRWEKKARERVNLEGADCDHIRMEPNELQRTSMKLTSQQKDLLVAIVDAHISGGEPFIFVQDVSQSSLAYSRGRFIRVNVMLPRSISANSLTSDSLP